VLFAEAFHHPARGWRGAGNGQVDVQAGDVVAQPRKFQHQAQRILAAGKGDQDAVVMGEQLAFFDAALHLPGKEQQEAFGTETGMVAGQGDDGRLLAAFAFHGVLSFGVAVRAVPMVKGAGHSLAATSFCHLADRPEGRVAWPLGELASPTDIENNASDFIFCSGHAQEEASQTAGFCSLARKTKFLRRERTLLYVTGAKASLTKPECKSAPVATRWK